MSTKKKSKEERKTHKKSSKAKGGVSKPMSFKIGKIIAHYLHLGLMDV